MGRIPTVNKNLPERMRARVRGSKTYYFYDQGGKPRKEVSLGTDYVLAVQQWAGIHEAEPTEQITVNWAVGKYLASPQFDAVSLGTQADYKFALDKILAKFGDAPMAEVRPSHITLYIDQRSAESKHRAIREKAVLSMLFSWCMARDYVTVNPVASIKTKRLPGRKNVYIEDEVLDAVYKHASPALKDAMDLAFYLGQRPADVLKLSETNIKNGCVTFNQNKTDKPIRIEVGGDLDKLIKRMDERKRKYGVRALQLLVDEKGRPLTKSMLRSRFEKAREAAGEIAEHFQFRDLRRKAAADLRDQVNIFASQSLLGHSNVEMTEHYAGGKARRVTSIPRKNG